MNCNDFELLMADALEGELSSTDQRRLDEHLARCRECSVQFDAAKRSLKALQSMPEPDMDRCDQTDVAKSLRVAAVREIARPKTTRNALAALRYAAVIALAFSGGYFWRNLPEAHLPTNTAPTSRVIAPADSLLGQYDDHSLMGALAAAHFRNPTQSNLAKCMAAMATP